MKNFFYIFFTLLLGFFAQASNPPKQVVYNLTIDYKDVHIAGVTTQAMLINDTLPAPTLYFNEGDLARIHVTNKMDVETSIHWHGILLPNIQDGVPYLTTAPILPGETYSYQFVLKQAGTYWYHSHTGLQEQRGIYGAIVVKPKQQKHIYDADLIFVLSDWTHENPNEVLRTLKRGSEWYSIKKNSTQDLVTIIKNQALGSQLQMWKNRMPGMDISDVYYPAFLINGKSKNYYPHFKAGQTLRLRVINASASSYFWLDFGGKDPWLIAADGMNVQATPAQHILHAIGETYDFLITIPKNKSLEFRATAQDGSGVATAHLGQGDLLLAKRFPKPSLMQHANHNKMQHAGDNHKKMKTNNKHKMQTNNQHKMKTNNKHKMQHAEDDHKKMKTNNQHKMKPADKNPDAFSYQKLRALTAQSANPVIKKIVLNLNGNMSRYIWSMNNKVLSESDKIQIKRGERLVVTLNNQTMMHHPMHLHGHFFRMINKHGKYSPLKHTVNVPPMEQVIIEFDPDETGDWFFHCHVLYHMMAGMSRVFSNSSLRASSLKKYPQKNILNKDNKWFSWGDLSLGSNQAALELVRSNTRNKWLAEATAYWLLANKNLQYKNFEISGSYERFLTDYFRIYAELELEDEAHRNTELAFKLGFRYLLPYFINLDISLDQEANLETKLEYELQILPRVNLLYYLELKQNLKHLNKLDPEEWTQEWAIDLEYIISKDWAIKAGYNKLYGYGAGFNFKF